MTSTTITTTAITSRSTPHLLLNERVRLHLGEQFEVGHSYFMVPDIASEAGQRRVWSRAIKPLLEEYFYNWRDSDKVLAEFQIERLLSDQEPQ